MNMHCVTGTVLVFVLDPKCLYKWICVWICWLLLHISLEGEMLCVKLPLLLPSKAFLNLTPVILRGAWRGLSWQNALKPCGLAGLGLSGTAAWSLSLLQLVTRLSAISQQWSHGLKKTNEGKKKKKLSVWHGLSLAVIALAITKIFLQSRTLGLSL